MVGRTRADDSDDHPFEPYDVVAASPEKLWAELSNPSWERRLTAHTELLRRGGLLLAEAVDRLADVKRDDPALAHLPWLAGQSVHPLPPNAKCYAEVSKALPQ